MQKPPCSRDRNAAHNQPAMVFLFSFVGCVAPQQPFLEAAMGKNERELAAAGWLAGSLAKMEATTIQTIAFANAFMEAAVGNNGLSQIFLCLRHLFQITTFFLKKWF